MGIFNTLGEIRRNKSNFKTWEQQEDNRDAQRRALYEKKPPTKDEFEKSKKVASAVIDNITIMDQHSENVAENIESVTQPLVGFAPTLGLAVSGLGCYLGGKPIINKFDNELKNIRNKITEQDFEAIVKINKGYMSKRDVVPLFGKCKAKIPEELVKKVADVQGEVKTLLKQNKKYIIAAPLIIASAAIGAYLATVLYTTKLQVQSSRIARWQSRENLKDPENFVQYTDKQVAQASENLKNKPEEKGGFLSLFKKGLKRKDDIGIFKTIGTVTRDNQKYREWKKIDDVTDDRVKRPLTPEEIEHAKKDKEVIQRIVRKINNKAEDYSENMETAAGVVLGSSLLGGALLGKAVPWVVEKTGIADLISKAVVLKNGGKESVAILKQLKDKKPDSPEYKKVMQLLEESVKKFRESKMANKSGLSGELESATTWLTKYVASNKGVAKIVQTITVPAVAIIGIVASLKLQKQAARAGRFVAKQELLDNPQEFIGYSEQDLQSVKDIKAPKKSAAEKLKEYLMFLPRVFKQSRDYNKFKNTEYKKQEALREELLKLDITDEQMLEAKNLQKKLFTTFEEVDDKSQEYSEHMEAANEIAQQGITTGAQFIPIGLIAAGAAGVASGRLSVAKTANGILAFLAKHTKILKTKLFTKYLGEVAKNGEKLVSRQFAYSGIPLQEIMQKAGLGNLKLNQTFGEIAQSMESSREDFVKYINSCNEEELQRYTSSLYDKFGRKMSPLSFSNMGRQPETMGEALRSLVWHRDLPSLRNKLITLFDITQQTMQEGGGTKLDETFVSMLKFSMGIPEDGQSVVKGFKSMLDAMDDKQVQTFVEELENTIQSKISTVRLGNIDKAYLTKLLDSISTISGNIPKEKVQEIITGIANAGLAEPDKFMQLLRNPSQFTQIFITPMVVKAGIGVGVAGIGVSYAVLSYFAKLQKEAGRLGVMRAMEELKDPAFYANAYTMEDIKKKKAS